MSHAAELGNGSELPIAGVLPAATLDERLAIVGTSGSGKTYAAKGLVEGRSTMFASLCFACIRRRTSVASSTTMPK